MHKLIEFVCDELEELERKAEKEGKLSMSEVQYADVLAHLKKDILTADAMWESSEYSEDGKMNSYRGAGSYARGGRRVGRMRSYSDRGRGSYESRYARAEDDMDSMIMELRGMMSDLPEEKKHEVQKFIDKIERM